MIVSQQINNTVCEIARFSLTATPHYTIKASNPEQPVNVSAPIRERSLKTNFLGPLIPANVSARIKARGDLVVARNPHYSASASNPITFGHVQLQSEQGVTLWQCCGIV